MHENGLITTKSFVRAVNRNENKKIKIIQINQYLCNGALNGMIAVN